ncbi:MAG: ribosome maturation factor RimM [Reichenbachiella sp.]
MKVEDCYQLGYVVKTHGLQGEVQLFLDVDNPNEYQNLESVFIKQDKVLIPFFLEYIQVNPKKSLAKFEEIDRIEDAETLVSSELYLPLNHLPKLKNGEYYLHQLVGLLVMDGENEIGTIEQVYEMGPQNLISAIHQGKEILIPISDGIIISADFDKNILHTQLPEGLLDVFLDED